MIHAYHVIFGTYGFWLPNDPRGSWLEFVYSWELARFGKASKSKDRVDVAPEEYSVWREAARRTLKYPPVTLSGTQALAVAEGFKEFATKSRLGVWACSILPEHVHLVVARHRYKIEQVVNLLKGAATRGLLEKELHPTKQFRASEQDRLPALWAEKHWKVFLDSEQAIENAIRYVEENPIREDKSPQRWSFVVPFDGISRSGWTTYY